MSGTPRLGVAYYPEQWPRERWELDAGLMADAGLSVVRIAEFAWSRLEPREGTFELEWLDEVVGILSSAGLDVILGTPTAAPPAWLIERHPEILPLRGDGRVHQFGHRRHYCPNQPAMQAASERIVHALAEQFGSDERVRAWQIDNELGGRCYCDTCHAAFHGWLAERYESLVTLNEVWGTAFWSQEYSAWNQIPLPDGAPVPMPSAFGFGRNAPNPGLALDFRRFSSDSLIDFLKRQVKVLRASCDPRQQITHNLMGFRFPEIDYHDLGAEIDIVSWDNYPVLDTSRRWTNPALAADAMRGLKRAPVWVLEQQAGALGWELVRSPRVGEFRLLSWQAIAHGAELVCYFRWRTARFGTEQHWHGIVEASGRVGRPYDELRGLAAELESVGGALAGARPHAEVALLHDYDTRFALQAQPTNPALPYEETVHAHYEALRKLGLGVDVLSTRADLTAYRAVIAPSLYVMDESTAAALTSYVESGGLLVLAPRTGFKDRCNAVPERPLPAWLDTLAGLEVVDYMSLAADDAVRIAGEGGFALEGELHGWYEQLAPSGATALATYMSGPFAGTPAITEHVLGDGKAVYVAGAANAVTLGSLYRFLGGRAGLSLLDIPHDVEAVPLVRDGHDLLVLLNHSDEQRVIDLGRGEWHTHLGAGHDERIVLEPLGVALVESERSERADIRAVADTNA
jgi:beta-galactosidase